MDDELENNYEYFTLDFSKKNNPNKYKVFDTRATKSRSFYENSPLGTYLNDGVFHRTELIEINDGKIQNEVSVIAPNSIGIFLTLADNNIKDGKEIFNSKLKFLENITSSHMDEIELQSKLIYDYIDKIQSAIIFGYTALESFINTSIPHDFTYKGYNPTRKEYQIYNKHEIERFIKMKVKVNVIMPKIFSVPKLNEQMQETFLEFKSLRDNLIHLKSNEQNEFYKNYFNYDIFEKLDISKKIIIYFINNRKGKNVTNKSWPWIEEIENDIPRL